MFSENLPFVNFIQPNLELIKLISNVLIIILIIAGLSSGGVSGAGAYFSFITAVIIGISSLAVSQLYKR
jgi:hypothetical protein